MWGPLELSPVFLFIQVRPQPTPSQFSCRVVAGVFLAPAITFLIIPGFMFSQSFGFYYPYAFSWAGRAVTHLMVAVGNA